MVNFKSLI